MKNFLIFLFFVCWALFFLGIYEVDHLPRLVGFLMVLGGLVGSGIVAYAYEALVNGESE